LNIAVTEGNKLLGEARLSETLTVDNVMDNVIVGGRLLSEKISQSIGVNSGVDRLLKLGRSFVEGISVDSQGTGIFSTKIIQEQAVNTYSDLGKQIKYVVQKTEEITVNVVQSFVTSTMNIFNVGDDHSTTWIRWNWDASGSDPIEYEVKVTDSNDTVWVNWEDIGTQEFYVFQTAKEDSNYTIQINATDSANKTASVTDVVKTTGFLTAEDFRGIGSMIALAIIAFSFAFASTRINDKHSPLQILFLIMFIILSVTDVYLGISLLSSGTVGHGLLVNLGVGLMWTTVLISAYFVIYILKNVMEAMKR